MHVLPTAAQEPSLYPWPDEIIGEFCVEVLEAEHLQPESVSAADSYVLLVFEGCCAVVSTIWNSSRDSFRQKFRHLPGGRGSPKWSHKANLLTNKGIKTAKS